MRNLKRVLTICVAVFLMISALTVVSFAETTTKFTDIRETDETLINAVSLLEALNVAKGTTETTFGTNQEVTRQQMAAFIYRLMNAGKTLEGGENFTPFEDLYDDTYFGMISWASSMNIIKGQTANKFNPDGTITLQDAYTMLVRALGYEEKETLSYPFDYINLAESDELDLGNGLPAKVNYTTQLTRGNVAIILYNTFYAEMAKTIEVEKEREIGKGTPQAKYVLEVVEEHPRLCEDVYGVVEENFTVRATTHYAFNESKTDNTYEPTEDSNGRGSMLLVATESNQNIDRVYTTIEQLGLTGKADDYIMADITLFYIYDNKNEEIDEIVYAQSNLKKVNATSASYTNVSAPLEKAEVGATETEYYYVVDSSLTPSGVRMSGDMKVAGNVMYFYDAPYTYLKPSYAGCTTEEERYAARNSDNTKLIDLVCLDADEGLYSFYVTDDIFLSKDGYGTDKTIAFATKFSQVRTGGIYEMDIFDPDGDGRFEYMWYKPATFTKIIMDDKYNFADYKEVKQISVENPHPDGLLKMPVLYANGARLEGEAFNDEDFVIAYVNGDGNLIKVFGVAQARKGTISGYDGYNGKIEIGYQTYRTCYQFRYVQNFFPFDNDSWNPGDNNILMYPFFRSSTCLDTEVILYTYNHSYNNVMYYEIVNEENEYAQEDLLIPIERYTQSSRADINSDYVQYLKVLLNGEEKYIPVNVEDSYPAPKAVGKTYDFGVTVTEDNGTTYDAYLNKLCTYTVDKNGIYTITSLLHATKDANGETPSHVDLVVDDDFFSEKKVNQAANDLEDEGGVYLKKVASNRYSLVDSYGNIMLGSAGTKPGVFVGFDNAYIDEATFIIRVVKKNSKGEYESKIVTYDGVAFPGTTESELTNVQFIYQNRGTSAKTVDLILFYGEVWDEDLTFESKIQKTEYVIVKNSQVKKVAADEFRYTYDVFNPATGELVTDILGTGVAETAKDLTDDITAYAAGSVVNVTSGGKIDDEETDRSDLIVLFDGNPADKKLAYVKDVILDDNLVELTPINSTDIEHYKWGADRDGAFELYELAEDVTVTMLKFGKKDDIRTAEISVLTLEELAEADDEIKCYTTSYIAPEDVENLNAEYSTEYCKYVKAYVTATYKSKYDYPIIDSIIVVVHPGQEAELDVE